jgi:hypothetical protein
MQLQHTCAYRFTRNIFCKKVRTWPRSEIIGQHKFLPERLVYYNQQYQLLIFFQTKGFFNYETLIHVCRGLYTAEFYMET